MPIAVSGVCFNLPPHPLQLPSFFFASDFYEAILYFSNASLRLFTQSIKIKYSFLLSLFLFNSHMERFFFSIHGQPGLLNICIDIALVVAESL